MKRTTLPWFHQLTFVGILISGLAGVIFGSFVSSYISYAQSPTCYKPPHLASLTPRYPSNSSFTVIYDENSDFTANQIEGLIRHLKTGIAITTHGEINKVLSSPVFLKGQLQTTQRLQIRFMYINLRIAPSHPVV